MQAARDLVGVLVEFSARVQLSHDDFGCGTVFFRNHPGGNPATVVSDSYGFISMNCDRDLAAVSSQRLVDRVIHRLKHQMV